jgi:hypothetical protein
MTSHTVFATSSLAIPAKETTHRRSVMIACALVLAPVILLAIYGANYYTLSQADRPFSAKHHLLKPSGAVGINMGVLGVLMLCAIFVYPLRKRWAWLQKQGNSRHWLDYHVILGIAAPVFIAFHSSFKFRGVAGIAFWVMVGVAVSGLVGRYLYGLIPPHIAEAELSLKVFRQILTHQKTVPQTNLHPLLHLPTREQAARWPVIVALAYVVASDLARPFHVAGLRVKSMKSRRVLAGLAGLLPAKDTQVEWVIGLAQKQAALSGRILFLTQMQRVFRLWHVVHKPFSYAFAVLALFHIIVAMLMGFL